jgi:hypothetical protein
MSSAVPFEPGSFVGDCCQTVASFRPVNAPWRDTVSKTARTACPRARLHNALQCFAYALGRTAGVVERSVRPRGSGPRKRHLRDRKGRECQGRAAW